MTPERRVPASHQSAGVCESAAANKKDLVDISLGVELGVDFFALSLCARKDLTNCAACLEKRATA
jgi:pyruvate kinase